MSRFLRLIRNAALAAVLLLLPVEAWAVATASIRNGLWNDTSTWDTGNVPTSADAVTITHAVWVDINAPAAASITLNSGGSLHIPRVGEASTVLTTTNGSVAVNSGAELVINGVLAMEVDSNTSTRTDGLTVTGGTLVVEGRTLLSGAVGTIATKDTGCQGITAPYSGGGGICIGADFAFYAAAATTAGKGTWPPGASGTARIPTGTLKAGGAALVFTGGQRKGRWYELTSVGADGLITVDWDSRFNADDKGHTSAYTATITNGGTTVTKTVGTNFSNWNALGSWVYCDADGVAERRRIKRVTSTTVGELESAYNGAGCAGAAVTLIDENQPFYAAPNDEQIKPGDSFQIIQPAGVISNSGADGTDTEQSYVTITSNGQFIARNAFFDWLGNASWSGGVTNTSGIIISGMDGATEGFLFDTVDIMGFAGEAAIDCQNCDNTTFNRVNIHHVHSLAVANEGHAFKFRASTLANAQAGMRITHSRVMGANDDCFWFAGRTTDDSGVFDSLCKYVPRLATGDTVDGVDTLPDATTSNGGGELLVERNVFANIGGVSGGAAIGAAIPFADSGTSPTATPIWNTGSGFVARDNIVLNMQEAAGIRMTTGTGRSAVQKVAFQGERVSVINNYAEAISGNAVQAIPKLYQNVLREVNTSRSTAANWVTFNGTSRGNIILGPTVKSGDTSSPGVGFNENMSGSGVNERFYFPATGAPFTISDNIVALAGAATCAGSASENWFEAAYPTAGNPVLSHNLCIPHPFSYLQQADSTGYNLSVNNTPDTPYVVTDNVILSQSPGTTGRAIFCANDSAATIPTNTTYAVGSGSPISGCGTPTGSVTSVIGGINAGALDFNIRENTPLYTAATTDSTIRGPRVAGVLAYRLPLDTQPVPNIPVFVDPQGTRARDTDGDGFVDFWDNCIYAQNPSQVDTDVDGIGDACE